MLYRLLQHTGGGPGILPNSIFVLGNDGADQVYGCVPNGGIGLSVVTHGDCFIQKSNVWEKQPKMFLYGLVRQVQWHKITAGYREITIVLRPHFLQKYLRARLSDLPENEAVHLHDLFDKSRVNELYEKLCAADDRGIVETVNKFLAKALRTDVVDARAITAHKLICEQKMRKVEEVSTAMNISSVTLRNLFRENIGITPKELIKIRRINESFRVKEHNETSLTRLAYKLDYFDQAHFIHDFKEATGITPKQYFLNERLTFDFYNFGRWSQDSFSRAL